MHFYFFSHNIDRLMGGGCLRRPPLMNYQFYIKRAKSMQKYTKHIKMGGKTFPKILGKLT